eukprot:8627531-Pyramimonas_sp.AAC.1
MGGRGGMQVCRGCSWAGGTGGVYCVIWRSSQPPTSPSCRLRAATAGTPGNVSEGSTRPLSPTC